MAQYLVAQWDYNAEGNYELSFKEGDKIKLLEKHNDDWWEGELNDEIGFFPANRTTSKAPNNSDQIAPPSNSNPYLKPQLPDRPKMDLLVDVSTDAALPDGWSTSYDQTGTIYFFNQSTGESQWERPIDDDTKVNDLVYDIQKLNLDALHPNWIRIQSNVQIKMVADEEIPWRDYYAVLSVGYLRPSSIKPVSAYGTVHLAPCEIIPATKLDTRKKNAFIVKDKHLKLIISVANETIYSDWLDAIMRESIAIKEHKEHQDVDLIQLLASIPLQKKLIKRDQQFPEEKVESKSTLTRWFSRSSRTSATKSIESPSITKEVFGGYLQLEEGEVPSIVRACVEQVDKRDPEQVNLSEENDINVITGLLKLYFRELKNPLFTYEYYDRVIEAARLQDYDERMFRLKSIVQVLPIAHYKVMQYLVKHLERVKDQSKTNKMESSNLALIFSIGLLRSKQDDLSSSILHSDLLSKVIEIIIQHVDWFFDDTNIF
ncbi:hypothetical protein HPULCUR_009926 [Helicostylum pulchrum]|uniref:Uncharacterized protein n=1 Tax=Helicostylum pulchrum TaxID=562976 RepID=A0ABP9YBU5_9FUNG